MQEKTIISYVWNGDCINNAELQQMLGLNSLEVGKILHQMVSKHLLIQEKKNRWTTYSIARKASAINSYKEKKKGDKKELIDNQEISNLQGEGDKKDLSDKKKKGDKKDLKLSELSVLEKQILTLIEQNMEATYETLIQEFGLSRTTLYKAVRHLKELQILDRKGGRKKGFWVLKNSLEGEINEPKDSRQSL